MNAVHPDRFVRLPTDLLEALLRERLSGTQWRIVGWVIRRTLGWNRRTTAFSWYRIASEVRMDRGGVVRAGHGLVRSGIISLEGHEIGIREARFWFRDRRLANFGDDGSGSRTMTEGTAAGDNHHRRRCIAASLYHRAKDSRKERSKTYKEKSMNADWHHRSTGGRYPKAAVLAGAAAPVPGKYDSLSQDR